MHANDRQVAGTHYKANFQHWDFVQFLALPYLQAQVLRYMSRWRKKNGLQDLEKAIHYMDKLIEVENNRRKTHRDIMEEYIREHNFNENERTVINMLVNFNLGDEERLDVARHAILTQIAVMKGEPPVSLVASRKAEDPKFREDGDEWRR